MASYETTTLVCLFHHRDRAQSAMEDILQAGVPEASVTLIGGDGSGVDALDKSDLAQLEMPDKDYDHLKQGIGAGGTVVAVQSVADLIDRVVALFKKHSAEKIDEADADHDYDSIPPSGIPVESATALPVFASAGTIDEDEFVDEGSLPRSAGDVVTDGELTSEPFKSSGGVSYPGSVRLYRFGTAAAGSEAASERDDLDRLP